jgi:outer membrane receptor for ferric coprogen and ferric-rhodotorulic acid
VNGDECQPPSTCDRSAALSASTAWPRRLAGICPLPFRIVPSAATGLGTSLSAFDQHLTGQQTIMDANLQGSFTAFGRQHDVLVGANYQTRDYDVDSQAYSGYPIDPRTYDPSANPTQPTTISRAATRSKSERDQSGTARCAWP